MTTISVSGPITAIEVSASFEIVPVVGGSPSSPATASPSGSAVTVLVIERGPDPGSIQVSAKLDSSFAVGSVVEVYGPVYGYSITDENGVAIASGSTGARMRKITTTAPTAGSTWLVV